MFVNSLLHQLILAIQPCFESPTGNTFCGLHFGSPTLADAFYNFVIHLGGLLS